MKFYRAHIFFLVFKPIQIIPFTFIINFYNISWQYFYTFYISEIRGENKIHTNYQNYIFELLLVGIAICIYILVLDYTVIACKYRKYYSSIKSENRIKGNMIRKSELIRLNIGRFHDDV